MVGNMAAAMAGFLRAVALVGFALTPGVAVAEDLAVEIVYLERQVERPPVLSNIDPYPEDAGLMGARLGIADNATTGKFLKHTYNLTEVFVPPDGDFLLAAVKALPKTRMLIVNAPAQDVVALADMEGATGALIFNVAAQDDALRLAECRHNVLHTIPSRAMLTDALAQFLMKKKWSDWFLIAGDRPGDRAYAEALRRSANKFRARIREEKTWRFDADMRRNASAEVPVFTQGPDYDVLVVADEAEDFARYILYNTWDPRPVAGSEGVSPRAWSPAVEQWGAAQLQSRFRDLAGRAMNSVDYAAWAAVRAIGEAVTRTQEASAQGVRGYLLSDEFALAGFKGLKLTFRGWNGQLRQPIPLVQPRALVALAPIEGYLHQRTELDTLGYDEPESPCAAFE